MGKIVKRRAGRLVVGFVSLAIFVMPLPAFGQSQTPAPTKITYHSNKYSPSDDVRLGRQAAQEVERQMPILHDAEATDYVSRVGQRLVAAIPEEFQHSEFHYYFKIVNVSDINAFALPGGPMFVNRGMIEAAKTEGEMAGVMAHELSHVALRHGTAQATKAQKYSILSGVLGVAGTVVGGPGLGQLAQSPVGLYFLRFSREYETEADLLGARIMSRAGYDPHDLANMFKTIERTSGGSSGPGFLSDHPAPKDRYDKINQESRALPVTNPITDNREFHDIQASLRGLPRAPSSSDIARGQRYPAGGSRNPNSGGRYPDDNGNYPDDNYPSRSGRGSQDDNGNYPDDNGHYPSSNNRRNRTGDVDSGSGTLGRVSSPSLRYRNYSELGVFQVNIPDNWREFPDQSSVWFAPEGGYGNSNGQSVYTHGVNFGLSQTRNRNLQQATDEFISNLEQGNNSLRSTGGYQKTTLAGRDALTINLSNTNEATGRPEFVTITTARTANGQLFYMIFVSPQNDADTFANTFRNVQRSVQFNN